MSFFKRWVVPFFVCLVMVAPPAHLVMKDAFAKFGRQSVMKQKRKVRARVVRDNQIPTCSLDGHNSSTHYDADADIAESYWAATCTSWGNWGDDCHWVVKADIYKWSTRDSDYVFKATRCYGGTIGCGLSYTIPVTTGSFGPLWGLGAYKVHWSFGVGLCAGNQFFILNSVDQTFLCDNLLVRNIKRGEMIKKMSDAAWFF